MGLPLCHGRGVPSVRPKLLRARLIARASIVRAWEWRQVAESTGFAIAGSVALHIARWEQVVHVPLASAVRKRLEGSAGLIAVGQETRIKDAPGFLAVRDGEIRLEPTNHRISVEGAGPWRVDNIGHLIE